MEVELLIQRFCPARDRVRPPLGLVYIASTTCARNPKSGLSNQFAEKLIIKFQAYVTSRLRVLYVLAFSIPFERAYILTCVRKIIAVQLLSSLLTSVCNGLFS